MDYVKYIEHSSENLQFFLWHRDYIARWETLQVSEKVLAPAWTPNLADSDALSLFRPKRVPPQIMDVLKNTDFVDHPKGPVDPFYTPPKAGSFEDKHDVQSVYGSSFGDDKTLLSSNASGYRIAADHAFEDAGMKWKPCLYCQPNSRYHSTDSVTVSAQPCREEVARIVSIYIAENSPRELNLSAKERHSVLHALQHTTHPSAFKDIVGTVEYSLRKQAHPNFIRWSICNGNRPRVVFARGLGAAATFVSFIADLLITLSSAGRAWRVLPIVGWIFGISTLIAAWKGMCVVLHGLHHRHLRPWELFVDDPEEAADEKCSSQETLGRISRNSLEEEPWVPRYKKRSLVRKIFDREIWIQEPALRQIQDTIFLQAIFGAITLSAVIVGIFCAVPRGNLF